MPTRARNPRHPNRSRLPWYFAGGAGLVGAALVLTKCLGASEGGTATPDLADRAAEPVAPATAPAAPTAEAPSPSPTEEATPTPSPSETPEDPHAELRRLVAAAVSRCVVLGYTDGGIGKNNDRDRIRTLHIEGQMFHDQASRALDEGSPDVTGLRPQFIAAGIDKNGQPTGYTYPAKKTSGGANMMITDVSLPLDVADGTMATFGVASSASSVETDGDLATTTFFRPCEGPSTYRFVATQDKWVLADTPTLDPTFREATN
ncbi:MAG TPA: hypothetical protein VFM05_02525 [Candidatus Saccharimonadales bacterium]|nr:hypothetical protein [Candidatus Saccharimonadales bacterium]